VRLWHFSPELPNHIYFAFARLRSQPWLPCPTRQSHFSSDVSAVFFPAGGTISGVLRALQVSPGNLLEAVLKSQLHSASAVSIHRV
jgi:hypothetical protein